MRDMISKKTRNEFREYFVGTTLREISQEFDAADVPFDMNYLPSESGQRRSLVEQYYHAVEFTSWHDVQKILRVYESVLFSIEAEINNLCATEHIKNKFGVLTHCLERDGFQYVDGKIKPVGRNAAIDNLAEIAKAFDADVLHQQLDRLRNAVEDDPSLAIGTAKELLETTCKTILADYGIVADGNWEINRLMKETRSILRLVPEDIQDSAKGAESIKRILSSLGQISQGLAELRNLYGTGHGKDGKAKGLSVRHARLAVACSSALATFLFDTHQLRQETTS